MQRARGVDARQIVVRKGRENYLCLLNLEDALQGGFGGRPAVLAQLVARWAMYSRDPAGTRFSPLTEVTSSNVSSVG